MPINETIQESDHARIVRIWETGEDRMAMVVQNDMHNLETGRKEPSYYTGYVQTTLTYADLCGEEDYPHRVTVHGGVTYGPDEAGWVGFDCNHAGDLCVGVDGKPLPATMVREEHARRRIDPEYVAGQCSDLADQLTELERELSPDDP